MTPHQATYGCHSLKRSANYRILAFSTDHTRSHEVASVLTIVLHSLRTCRLRAVRRYGRPRRAAQRYITICMQPYYIVDMFHTAIMVTMMVNERKNDGPNLARWETHAIDSVHRLQNTSRCLHEHMTMRAFHDHLNSGLAFLAAAALHAPSSCSFCSVLVVRMMGKLLLKLMRVQCCHLSMTITG